MIGKARRSSSDDQNRIGGKVRRSHTFEHRRGPDEIAARPGHQRPVVAATAGCDVRSPSSDTTRCCRGGRSRSRRQRRLAAEATSQLSSHLHYENSGELGVCVRLQRTYAETCTQAEREREFSSSNSRQ